MKTTSLGSSYGGDCCRFVVAGFSDGARRWRWVSRAFSSFYSYSFTPSSPFFFSYSSTVVCLVLKEEGEREIRKEEDGGGKERGAE